jgi:hypothetical protein
MPWLIHAQVTLVHRTPQPVVSVVGVGVEVVGADERNYGSSVWVEGTRSVTLVMSVSVVVVVVVVVRPRDAA